jgi:hypothetical protein
MLERLINWMARHPFPLLTALHVTCNGNPGAHLVDRAFRFFAGIDALQTLSFNDHHAPLQLETVLQATQWAPNTAAEVAGVNNDDGGFDDDIDNGIRKRSSHAKSGRSAAPPLRQLTRLAVSVAPIAVPALVCRLPRVCELELTTDGCAPAEVILALAAATAAETALLSSSSSLQSLKLMVGGRLPLTPAAFAALGSFTQLHTLDLWCGASGATDGDSAQLFGRLGRLEVLEMAVDMPAAPRRLGIIGACCRQLQHLFLQGEVYFDDSFAPSAPSPLFPRLQQLRVTALGVLLDTNIG